MDIDQDKLQEFSASSAPTSVPRSRPGA